LILRGILTAKYAKYAKTGKTEKVHAETRRGKEIMKDEG
jgi:hypothetical protein